MAESSSEIPTVKIIYNSTNMARHPVSGTTTQRLIGKSLNYGWRKPGDVFVVAVSDVIARPDLYYSFPCNEPFKIENGKLIDPCEQVAEVVAEAQPVESAVAEAVVIEDGAPVEKDDLQSITGIGKVVEKRLNEQGISTFADIKSLTEEQISELDVPKRTKVLIKKWQSNQ